VEAFFIPKAQKSTTGEKQSQGAAVFFVYRRIVHHSYPPEGQLSTKDTIWKSSVIFVMQFGTRDRICGPRAIGNCIMTMLRLVHHT
jgi:hypothetical protein